MTNERISFPIISLIIVLVAIGLITFGTVSAQTADPSEDATTTPSSEDIRSENGPTTLPFVDDSHDQQDEDATPSQRMAGLNPVRVSGTKYIDYCTDGATITAFPGDPEIDANLHKPDAPTPKCPDGMTWDHTSGVDAFDTPSGDLEVGNYAQQSDGTYIAHYPAIIYTDATSTSEWPARIQIVSFDPTEGPATQTPSDVPSASSSDAQESTSTEATL